ncbi:f1d124c8-70e3-4456-accf-40de68c5b032 [Sclerotinia trifoliorum]|uniref:F1d124c8-70e3-4456-accf-40de68c5b032 n=1 Tax=Sclerotinia trifoliorum TaxID=28548 RepID=A0A8H2VRQ5_9HELO|nr:f1d124c8-70e3-4456-accf-40de68c5b032 [Sclerotinia trifoliorum]
MIHFAAEIIQAHLGNLVNEAGHENSSIGLWAWVQHEITVATTESIYGPANPYRDAKVEAGFWDFANDSITLLLTTLLPAFLASKPIKGRAIVVEAMSLYFADGGQKMRFLKRFGNRLEQWQPPNNCLKQIVLQSKINLRKLKDVSILFSAQQEALRFRATGSGPRMVMEDMIVGDNQYLLKKGSIVIIANKALHFDEKTWGENAGSFHAGRFCGKVSGHAFRGFSGGVNSCPGRGFAMAELAALVAMLAMRFDVIPVRKTWIEPGQDLNNLSVQIAPPKRKVMVNIVTRENSSQENWCFE